MRMVGVKLIVNDTDFQPELSAVGSRLAVVKFTMRGCGPCLRIAPAFNALSNKYLQAMFLEVDVHQCQGTAATNNISATPTFLFFRNKVRIDQYQGADVLGLEEKIKQHLENDPGNNEDTDIPKGYMDLMPFINKAGCECLNESDEHGFDNCLRKDSTYLESDCDEQLLITVAFSQPVKLYSMKLQGPDNGQGPKYVKIFINLPRSMDFEEAETSEPTQALELTPDDIKEDGIVQLRYVKFQNVNCVTAMIVHRCLHSPLDFFTGRMGLLKESSLSASEIRWDHYLSGELPAGNWSHHFHGRTLSCDCFPLQLTYLRL
ncbi:thioredoxin-like protein 1 isoform X2 [Meleagris gallopavo]|uniref:thioredoxin-like protein 1 isoform X2 n=1 Tax=Meleagris gallopavo TaxID=9103 RepID=UPI00093D55CA|nr:thioredoxin-like protein 1 isoform X2 [Meleagris gallopavo]